MTTELYWLTLTALMTALFWLPYILDRLAVRGVVPTLTDRQAETGAPHSSWAKRAMRAHQNAIENLVIFATVVLVAHAANVSTPVTEAAAIVYFGARLAHFVIYTLGIPLLRTVAFAAGWAAQIAIIASILGWI
jgi:uncharacterized MAPEG superfamily protein